MNIKDLKPKHLVEIVRLYEQYCGRGRDFERALYTSPKQMLSHLKEDCDIDYRIGSKWDSNSKLCLKYDIDGTISVWFNSNFDPHYRTGQRYETAEKAGQDFEDTVKNYLIAEGLTPDKKPQ